MGYHNTMSEAERDHAVALYLEHRSTNAVAAILGRSKEAIRRVLHRRGVSVASPGEVRARGPSTRQRVPVVPHDYLERVVQAGRLYTQFRNRQREIERKAWPR